MLMRESMRFTRPKPAAFAAFQNCCRHRYADSSLIDTVSTLIVAIASNMSFEVLALLFIVFF
jgi:hypothetical protein